MTIKVNILKFFLLLISPFFSYSNNIKLGLFSSVNFSTISATNSNDQFNNGKGFLPGYDFGLSFENEFDSDYSLVYSIGYTTRGYSTDQLGIRIKSFSKYLEIPVKIHYKLINGFAFQAGPYFGIALKEFITNNISKSKSYGKIGNNIYREPPDTLKRLDLGVQTALLYNLNKFDLGFVLTLGILNTRPGGGIGSSVRNLSTQIRLIYNFWKIEKDEKTL